MFIDNQVKKPAEVERLTNQLQNKQVFRNALLARKKVSLLEDLGRAVRHIHEREKRKAAL
jgi:hypothetical protein